MAAVAGQDLHLQQLITEAVSNTCRQYFSSFKTSLTLAGTIGITVDNRHVCIVHVLDQLLPDTPYNTKHLVVHPSDKRPAACISQNVCVAGPSNSSNVITNKMIVIEPSLKKHKQSVQSLDKANGGNARMGMPVVTRNNKILTPENSSLLCLLTTGSKPKDTTEKQLVISTVWGSTDKPQASDRNPLPVQSSDNSALDLCTGSEHVMMVAPDHLDCVSQNNTCSERPCIPSDTAPSSHPDIDYNTAQFLQQFIRRNANEGMTNWSSLDDASVESAAKRIKLEAVEIATKQRDSASVDDSAAVSSLPSGCAETLQTCSIADNTSTRNNVDSRSYTTHPGCVTRSKLVLLNEEDAKHTNSPGGADIQGLARASSTVKSEGTIVKVQTSSRCGSENSEIDLTTGTAMTMNDLVDFYIRKEIFHNRK